ncbi:MAG: LysM peptidoglycan-binding domain-containing protein [Roseburia sp.]
MRNKRVAKMQRMIFASVFFFMILIAAGFLVFGVVRTKAADASPSYKYYTSIRIERGDTIWEIASDYLTDDYQDIEEYIEEICALNAISEDCIHAGRYLTLPYYSAEAPNE